MGSERRKTKTKPWLNSGADDSTSGSNVGSRFSYRKKKNLEDETQTDKENLCDAKRSRKILTKIEMDSNSILNSPSWNSSIVHYLTRMSNGERYNSKVNQLRKKVIINQISRYRICKASTPFDRRVTAITWHPVYPQVVVAASKGGDILLQFLNKPDHFFKRGIGPGGSVVGLKCSADDPDIVYTASITGNIMQEDLNRKESMTLLSLFSKENFFASLDICQSKKLLVTGDCCGYAYVITTAGEKVWPTKKRLHKGKITHAEFSPINPDIVATASLDTTVKLWDLRMISEENSLIVPTHEFPHEKAVNSACFSPSSSYSLLTTDQYSQIRVYSSPCWDEITIINHPHRKFQHMTPIKAIWHPIEDIIVVGRYPDANFLSPDARTIDYYDGSNGNLLHKMNSPLGYITSVNAFNATGDSMASSAGYSLVLFSDGNVIDSSNVETDDKPLTRSNFNELKSRKGAQSAKRIKTEKKYLKSKLSNG